MELRHLRYFVAVAEELHFRRAAQRLHLAQPALSQQIKDLEHELGTALFVRNSRRVELTEGGRILLRETRTLLNQLAQAINLVQATSREDSGVLKIGFATSAGYTILPDLLREFNSAFSKVVLHCQDMTAADQLDGLKKGEIDIGLVRLPVAASGVTVYPLLTDGMVMVLPRNHPVAQKTITSLQDFSADTFILFPRQKAPGAYDHIIECCRKAGFSPKIGHESADIQSIFSMISAGFGVSLGPASLQKMQLDDIAYVPLEPSCGSFELGIAIKEGATNTHLAAFIKISEEIVRRQKGQPPEKHYKSHEASHRENGSALPALEGSKIPFGQTNGNGSARPTSKPHPASAVESRMPRRAAAKIPIVA